MSIRMPTKVFLGLRNGKMVWEREGMYKPAPERPAKPRRGVPNKWEKSFHQEVLAPLFMNGGITEPRFEEVTLTIYSGVPGQRPCKYTCDWFATDKRTGRGLFWEVKGRRRDGGIVRLKAAAAIYTEFCFHVAEGGPGAWRVAEL